HCRCPADRFLLVAFFVVYRSGFLLGKLPRVGHMMEELSRATVQIKVRAAFTIMLVFVVLAQRLGTEVILGAFLAGAAIALLRTPADTELGHRLEAMGFGFFIPIFFVMVGAQFNLNALTQHAGAILLVPALIAVGAIVKLVPALVFRLSFSWRETFAAGALLSARLSLIIAAAAIGVRVGFLDEAVSSAVILVAIVSVTVGPIVFSRLMAIKQEPRTLPVVVVGANELGLHVAERLRRQREDVVLVDAEESRVERARAWVHVHS
ncbi:MAG TPA: cation:proton antiporter, partial [Chloroflexota bacterium]|nr:cation:proton antiporter [Chloroflexota bacterium]